MANTVQLDRKLQYFDENGVPIFHIGPTGLVGLSVADTLAALAGGAQAGTPITKSLSRFTTVTTIGDSGQLPKAQGGTVAVVQNSAANSMNVFPQTGETINALAANAAFAVAGGKSCLFFCVSDGKWYTLLSA